MIYSHKPQRSGRSIAANTNNPPQDPPPPPDDKVIGLDDIPVVPYETEIPDVLIEDSTPPVMPAIETPEIDIVEIPEIVKPIRIKAAKKPKAPKITPKITPTIEESAPVVKLTWRLRIVSFFKKLFRRS